MLLSNSPFHATFEMTEHVLTDDELRDEISRLRGCDPSIGIARIALQLKSQGWAVSEKRLRKVHMGEPGLMAKTGLDPSIDLSIAPKVKVKMFGGEKGKGLIAKEKILRGEIVWQEEPWIVTADP